MLIDGITLTSTATFTGIDQEKTLSQPGVLSVVVGTARWYPSADIDVLNVRASVNTAPSGADVIVNINKNGALFATLTIIDGTNISSTVVPGSPEVLSTDYLTVDVTQIGSGASDMAVQVTYETK